MIRTNNKYNLIYISYAHTYVQSNRQLIYIVSGECDSYIVTLWHNALTEIGKIKSVSVFKVIIFYTLSSLNVKERTMKNIIENLHQLVAIV